MAQLSLGETKWRMLRLALKKRRFKFADCRNWARNDQEYFDWLVANGFFKAVGEELYEVTQKGKAAADLGMYEFESAPTVKPAVGQKGL